MIKETEDIVRYRLQRARETIDEARLLLDGEHLNGAMNRTYYSMFYAADALLAARNLSSSRHSRVIAPFGQSFVTTGEFPRELYHQLDRAFDMRTTGDYKDLTVLEKATLQEMLENATAFVTKVEEIVRPMLTS